MRRLLYLRACPQSYNQSILELIPFHRHLIDLIVHKKEIEDVNQKTTVPGAIPSTNG